MGHLPTPKASAQAGCEVLGSGTFDAEVIDTGLRDDSGLAILEATSVLPCFILMARDRSSPPAERIACSLTLLEI